MKNSICHREQYNEEMKERKEQKRPIITFEKWKEEQKGWADIFSEVKQQYPC